MCETALTGHQSALSGLKGLKSCLSTEMRIFKSISLFPLPPPQTDLIFFPSPPPPELNCNLKSVWCKYCYCWRRNQTFMRERDLGRDGESRSQSLWDGSFTESLFLSLLFVFSASFPSPLSSTILAPLRPPPRLSFVFLYSLSPYVFCFLISPHLLSVCIFSNLRTIFFSLFLSHILQLVILIIFTCD